MMKYATIMLILLCLLLTACVQEVPENAQSTTCSTTSTTVSTIISTHPTTGPGSLLPPYFYTDSYASYNGFFVNHEIADHIILLEELPYMGTFSSMQFTKDPNSKQEIHYLYNLTTVTGDRLSIYFLPLVTSEEYLYPDDTDISKFAKGSLLTNDAEANFGYVRMGDVVYRYHFGKLVGVSWAYEGYVINLDPPESWCDDIESIKNEPEFIQQLLHTNTVEAAMQTFASAMAVK